MAIVHRSLLVSYLWWMFAASRGLFFSRRSSASIVVKAFTTSSPSAHGTMSSKNTNNKQPLYWDRVTSSLEKEAKLLQEHSIVQSANIVCLADPNDPANQFLYKLKDPKINILQIVTSVDELDPKQLQDVNCVFISHPGAREPLAHLLQNYPQIVWIHSRSAGIDTCVSNDLRNFPHVMTNAKGQFSSTLAEYTMSAMGYFAKDFDRLKCSQKSKQWDKFSVKELRGSVLGIVGYGDIGKATAQLAKVFGMKILALGRRTPAPDGIADEQFDATQLQDVLERSDYVLCATPLTAATKHMMSDEQFDMMKGSAVFINLGRGPTVDENALLRALENNTIRGAALDVFEVEPLPPSSKLWELDNVLLSPHNMDQTETFMHESTEFFTNVQIPRFVRNLDLYNPVDVTQGY